MRSIRFFKLLVVEVIAVILVVAFVLIDAKDVYQWWVGNTTFVNSDTTCDLHKNACDVRLNDGSPLRLEIEPKNIPLMQPLQFKVTTSLDVPTIEIKLFATNMNMGLHTIKLAQTAKGVYEGEGMLPTCITGNMIWQANVIANQKNKSLGAIFSFKTDK